MPDQTASASLTATTSLTAAALWIANVVRYGPAPRVGRQRSPRTGTILRPTEGQAE